MRCIIGGDLSQMSEAVKRSEFFIDSGIVLGDVEYNGLKSVKCPTNPSTARTAIYLMHVPNSDCVIFIGDVSVDDELSNLALSFKKPIYIHYTHPEFTAGIRMNYEEDF